MMLAIRWVLARQPDEAAAEPMVHQTIRVDREQPISLDDLSARYQGQVTFTRLKHEHAANPARITDGSAWAGRADRGGPRAGGLRRDREPPPAR